MAPGVDVAARRNVAVAITNRESPQPAVEEAGNEAPRVVRPAVDLAAVAAAPVLRVLLRRAEEGLAVVVGGLLGSIFG